MPVTVKMWDAIKIFFYEYFLATIKQMRIIDFIDILILAFIFYFIYSFIRDRRAGKLALGLLLIVGLYIFSSSLKMYALEFVFQNFLQIGVIAVMIVFQPELRAALEKVGGTSFFGLKGITIDAKENSALNEEIDAICKAVSDLSRDKIGALIVIERSTKLGEYIKSGGRVDSVLSPHILKNIFFNNGLQNG